MIGSNYKCFEARKNEGLLTDLVILEVLYGQIRFRPTFFFDSNFKYFRPFSFRFVEILVFFFVFDFHPRCGWWDNKWTWVGSPTSWRVWREIEMREKERKMNKRLVNPGKQNVLRLSTSVSRFLLPHCNHWTAFRFDRHQFIFSFSHYVSLGHAVRWIKCNRSRSEPSRWTIASSLKNFVRLFPNTL